MSDVIDRNSLVVGTLPRITPAQFRAALERARSPAANEAEACWEAVAREGVDPLFALAVFKHESGFGRLGVCSTYQTRNPGNTRSSRTGVGEVIQTERGAFVRYPSWEEGFRDLAYRLVDPSFVYRQRGLRTISEIIPVWAPVSDNNVPASYIRAVEEAMNELAQAQVPGVPYRVALIPFGNRNRPALPMRPQWVTVHETANTSLGANAEMHRRFVWNGGGSEGVSFHLVVDDHEVIQLLPLDEVAWHAGDGPDGPGNRTSVAIELCVHAGSDWARTQEHGARLAAALCRAFGLPAERVVPHQHWSGKQCPRRLLAQGFERFRDRVRAMLADQPVPSDVVQLGPWGRVVGHGFLAFWRLLERADPSLPLRTLGWPRTDEFSFDENVYQVFERAVLKWERRGTPPWDVHVVHLDEAARVLDHARSAGLIAS